MKKLSCVMLIFLILVIPLSSVHAQTTDERARWKLTQSFTVTDLNFEFLYPQGWTVQTDGGISLALNKDEIIAATDGDDTTFAKGIVIQLNTFSLEELGLDPQTVPLNEAVDTLAGLASVEEIKRFDLPVMTRRTVNIFGGYPDGTFGIATLWLQGDSVVIFEYNATNQEVILDHAFSWEQLLATAHPINTLEMITEPHFVASDKINILYPDGWGIQNEGFPFTVGDIRPVGETTGYSYFTVRAPLSEFAPLTADSTLEDVIPIMTEQLGLVDNLGQREHILFDNPAISIYGTNADGIWLKGLFTLIAGDLFVIVHGAPTTESVADFESTWIAILESIELVEE